MRLFVAHAADQHAFADRDHFGPDAQRRAGGRKARIRRDQQIALQPCSVIKPHRHPIAVGACLAHFAPAHQGNAGLSLHCREQRAADQMVRYQHAQIDAAPLGRGYCQGKGRPTVEHPRLA